MRYDIIEKAIVDLIKPLKLSNGGRLAEKCDQYDGEFDQRFQIPEDYHPASRYVFCDARGAAQTGASVSTSGATIQVFGDVVLFIGSENENRLRAKNEHYEMIDIVQKAVHKKKIIIDGIAAAEIRWINDAREFTLPNHLCTSMTLQLRLYITIENG